MSIELNDEVPVPRFEDNLSRELARVYEQEHADAPRGRGPGRRTVLAGVASIAAAAMLIAGILVAGSDKNDESGVEAKIIAATEDAMADLVVHTVTDWAWTTGPVDQEGWGDQTSLSIRFLNYAEDGELSSDWGQTEVPAEEPPGELPPGTRLMRTVDYCFEEYSVEEREFFSPAVVASIAEDLARGWMREDGTEVVDGRELIRVVVADSGPYSPADATWLVDPETYLPVQLVGDASDGTDAGPDIDQGYVTTFEYLPRTPDNLAQLRAADPPAGFVQVDELSRTTEARPCS